jgi:ribosome biogenesis GTPase
MTTLKKPGIDQWFESHSIAFINDGYGIARVSAVDRGAYQVRNDVGELPAVLAGKFSFRIDSSVELPCTGDWVAVHYHNDGNAAIIHAVFPRRSFLRRKAAGDRVDFQLIAANIDIAFIVQSCHFDFNVRRLDRYRVMAADGGVDPVILLAKTDLVAENELKHKIESIRSRGIKARVLALSNVTGDGFAEFSRALEPGRTYCLLGSSGVGKTTLLNRLIGRDALVTKAVSKTGEGIHTTSRRQLILLEQGAMLIDTPGMRELGMLGTAEGMDRGFEDIGVLASHCRFLDCTHEHEPGCAVRAAVQNGQLDEDSYFSYKKLKKESAFHEMSYIDKRKKDKAFGRFIKNTKKQIKRNRGDRLIHSLSARNGSMQSSRGALSCSEK